MSQDEELGAIARAIIDANQYMTLGTADSGGRPWVSPVFFAPAGSSELYWISSPEGTHSRNLAVRPQVSIVVFDSRQPAGEGRAVYMSATAEQLSGADLDRGLEVYPGPERRPTDSFRCGRGPEGPGRGAWTMTAERLQPPAPYRLYRARVSEHWMLCPRESGPCELHGRAYDHRTPVTPEGA
jgi:hypothetical protein